MILVILSEVPLEKIRIKDGLIALEYDLKFLEQEDIADLEEIETMRRII